MWRTPDGDRVLTDPEWGVFCTGLDSLRYAVEEDIAAQSDDTQTGVPAFDRLTGEQKLSLLAEVASAFRDPSVPTPRHTAANEGAVMAVMQTFRDMLRAEVELNEEGQTALRETLLAVVADTDNDEEPLPEPTADKWQVWDDLYHEVEGRLFWDSDFAMGDEFLDLPPDQARVLLDQYGIDEDYYLDTPPEPGERGLTAARQTLARLIGLPVPDDHGLYPALLDRYHDLTVGPVTPEEVADWGDHPWVELIGSPEPDWECDYTMWRSEFAGVVPTTPFTVSPAKPGEKDELPDGVRVERSGDGWVVRDEDGWYWCGLVDNGWADGPDQSVPALSFPTEADAVATFVQADRMYGERADRRAVACERLEISDEEA